MAKIVIETDFEGLTLFNKGKVRDVYDLGDAFLMVTTDRISAFDVIMHDPIPDKGKILTKISTFWFDKMSNLVENHIISTDVEAYPDICRPYREDLRDRSMLVKKAKPLPIECIVRGYITGSGWADYQKTGGICGIQLPEGLQESDRLPKPIFTPSTKAELGKHDENIDFTSVVTQIGPDMAEKVQNLSLAIYTAGIQFAEGKGIIIADTKFEFGIFDGRLILIDEVLTPDSSRFWPKDTYAPGGSQNSFDKQYLRDYLLSINWNKQPPPPPLPENVIQKTRAKYLEALTRLAGSEYGL